MNIAIDIDDTLTDSFAYFQPFVAEYFGAPLEELKAQNISYSNLPPRWKDRELDFCKACYDRTAADTPFKPDAAWGVETLKALGHRIIIITGRSTAFYTDPYETTRRELANGGIPYDKLICTTDKGTACREEQIQVLIDDLGANCAAAAGLGIHAIQFESPANRDETAIFPRVRTWAEAVEAIDNL